MSDSLPTVRALQHVKAMRGGANAHLMLADDGYYVVKFSNNPQHRRVLVNELICSSLLDYLGLPVPVARIVEVPQSLIDAAPALSVNRGRTSEPCAAGLHFGSQFPVDPTQRAVYDYLPVTMLRGLLNRRAFLGMLAFDKWINNTDARQAVFHRTRADKWPLRERHASRDVSSRSLVHVASFIDHGLAFDGERWLFPDGPLQGLYPQGEVYEEATGLNSFEPWLSRIQHLPPSVLDNACKQVPGEWYDQDPTVLANLMERLYTRRSDVARLLLETKAVNPGLFPCWSKHKTSVAGR